MKRLREVAWGVIVLCFVAAAGESLAAEALHSHAKVVKNIVDATGIRGGLAVHVGCGDGKLAAAFGKLDGFLVQGLERSEAKIAEAREQFRVASKNHDQTTLHAGSLDDGLRVFRGQMPRQGHQQRHQVQKSSHVQEGAAFHRGPFMASLRM